MKKTLQIIVTFIVCLCISSCSSCSSSGRKGQASYYTHSPKREISQKNENIFSNGEKTIIKMKKVGGVYQIPVDVNGVRMSFIFDTGASSISISNTEALFLAKQGLLSKEDIKGSESFTDAIGNISQGTIIVLRTVKIGDRVLHDIDASVVNNLTAPLLFGQTAMKKFGKISIDNTKGEVTFE